MPGVLVGQASRPACAAAWLAGLSVLVLGGEAEGSAAGGGGAGGGVMAGPTVFGGAAGISAGFVCSCGADCCVAGWSAPPQAVINEDDARSAISAGLVMRASIRE